MVCTHVGFGFAARMLPTGHKNTRGACIFPDSGYITAYGIGPPGFNKNRTDPAAARAAKWLSV
jgi:hypothetical protein